MTTSTLGIPQVAASQNNKEVTINEADQSLENLVSLTRSIPVTASFALSSTDFRSAIRLNLTGTPVASFNVRLPAASRMFIVRNSSGQSATIGVDPSGGGFLGTTVTIPDGGQSLIISDGIDVNLVSSDVQAEEIIFEYALSDEVTAITSGDKLSTRVPYDLSITDIRISLSQASSSGSVQVDVQQSGSSIFSTVASVDQGEKTSATSSIPHVLSDTTLTNDSELVFSVIAPGTGATGLKIKLYTMRS